jgi:tol-pal system protein YbgF
MPRRGRPLAALALLASVSLLPGCYAPQLSRLQTGLDSLRAVVDTLSVRDSVTRNVLMAVRRDIAEQRDVMLATRAATGTSSREIFEQQKSLEVKLEEVLGRFTQLSERRGTGAPGGAGAGEPPAAADRNQLYDQATQDLTQGRYALALQGFRDFLRTSPQSELADNARYGVGESFFALARFDSAAVEYERVTRDHPTGDRVPAAMYKLALSQEKLGRAQNARKTLEDLVKRFPDSGEAQLARERLGGSQRR